MNSQLPHEVLMTLEDKAKMFDKVLRAHSRKLAVMKDPMSMSRNAVYNFNHEINKIMRDAERFGFLPLHPSTNNQQNVH